MTIWSSRTSQWLLLTLLLGPRGSWKPVSSHSSRPPSLPSSQWLAGPALWSTRLTEKSLSSRLTNILFPAFLDQAPNSGLMRPERRERDIQGHLPNAPSRPHRGLLLLPLAWGFTSLLLGTLHLSFVISFSCLLSRVLCPVFVLVQPPPWGLGQSWEASSLKIS